MKFKTRPEWTDRWPQLVSEFTEATRAEEGIHFFDWSRSLDDPTEYVLVEGFRDGEAGGVHVKKAIAKMPQALAATPQIISQTIEATGWSEMGEMKVA